MIKYHGVYEPLKEAIHQIIGKEPPFDFDGAYRFSELPAAALNQIEDWCSLEISGHGVAEWATGSSVVSAAEIMVEEAQWDANIAPNPIVAKRPQNDGGQLGAEEVRLSIDILVDLIEEWEEIAKMPIAKNWKKSPLAREDRRESKVYGNCAQSLRAAIGHRLAHKLMSEKRSRIDPCSKSHPVTTPDLRDQ